MTGISQPQFIKSLILLQEWRHHYLLFPLFLTLFLYTTDSPLKILELSDVLSDPIFGEISFWMIYNDKSTLFIQKGPLKRCLYVIL